MRAARTDIQLANFAWKMKVLTIAVFAASACLLTNARIVEMKLRPVRRHCEKITAPMCRGALPYSSTEFPNSLDHYNQKMALRSLEIYKDLMATNCSKHLAFFVCAYHLPVCMKGFPETVKPCREVCEQVKRDCAEAIQRLGGSSHAETVRCQDLPAYDSAVCIKEESFVKKIDKNSCGEEQHMKFKAYSRRNYSFVLKMQVMSITKSPSEANTTLVGGNVTRILTRGKVPIKKGLLSLSFVKAPCVLRLLKKDRAYIIAGHESVPKDKLVVRKNGLVLPAQKKWFLRLKKWEARKNGQKRTSRRRTQNRKRPQ